MPDRFKRLKCNEWKKIEDSVSCAPHNKFAVPAWGPFDFEEYANHISRKIKYVNNMALREIKTLWRYHHCQENNCTHKFFTFAIKDSPIDIDYQGISTSENRDWHIYEINYTRNYIVFMECQNEPLEKAQKLDHLRTTWEHVEEFIEASKRLT